MIKFVILIFLIPLLLEAQDTMRVYQGGKTVPKSVAYSPGYWRIVLKDGRSFEYPNASFKIQKMIVPVEENFSQTTETQIYPQPFDDIVNIEFELQKDAEVFYEIINQAGQVIFSSNRNFMFKGKNKIQWNGIDYQGNSVKSGIYYMKIKNGSSVINEKLLVIK